MVLFHSMTQVTVYIAATVFVLLLLALRKNPLRVAGTFVREMITSRKYALHFAAMIAVLFFNKIELWVESKMRPHGDFTLSIYKLEGNLVAWIQHAFENDALTVVLSYFYVVLFPSLMIASIGIYTFQKNYKLYYALCYALMINYMVAIPFYLFFPVNEVWHFHPDVDFPLLQVFPTFETEYRPLSGLNNCFPSLHTSISVSLAVIAMKSRNAFWERFVLGSAAVIIFSIFYLGIHWFADMSAGVLLGLFASQAALRLSEERAPLWDVGMAGRLKQRNAGEKW